LINPNQCRSFGLSVCDDPTDNHRDIGMQLLDSYFLPFKMRGTTCYFDSRSPTFEELESCPTFVVSDEHDWDPTADMFISAVERGHSVCASVFSFYQHDFDRIQGCPAQIIAQIRTSERHHGVNARLLSLKWGIGLEKAKNTINHTTQMNIRSAVLPLTRRYRTDLLSQRLRRLNSRFYTDTMFSKIGNSLRGNSCAQVFTDGNGAVFIYPMKGKSEVGAQLIKFIQQVGIPNEMHRDGAPEMKGSSQFMKICQEYRIRSTFTEPNSPWQNRCENTIGVLSKKVKARRARRRIPKCVWDFHLVWEAQIYSRTVHKNHCTPLEALTGDTIDISEWTEFEFYDLVVYWDDRENEARQSIGRWLGPSHHIGSALCYYILTEKATVLSRTSVQHITKEEFATSEMQDRVKAYHLSLDEHIESQQEYENTEDDQDFTHDDVALPVGYEENEGDYFGLPRTPDIDEMIKSEDAKAEADSYDKFIGVDVVLPNSADQKLMARVRKKISSDDRNEPNYYNPLRDHSKYEIVFPDGTTDEVEANIIAESMVSECDPEGRQYKLLKEISDHRKDNTALNVADGRRVISNTCRKPSAKEDY